MVSPSVLGVTADSDGIDPESRQEHGPSVIRLMAARTWSSGMLSPRLRGTWTSPTFTLSTRQIHYRLASRSAVVRVYVDGHFMNEVHQLLFAGTYDKVDSRGRAVWHVQRGNLDKYVGQRLHLEIEDSGDGYACVEQIRLADRAPVEPPTVSDDLVHWYGRSR